MNFPNLLSVSRVILIIPIILLFEINYFLTSCFIFIFASLTGGRSLQYLAINHMGAARSSSLVACSPFFAAILAVVFLGESINIWLILGTTLIVSGVVLVSLSSEKNE